MTKDEILKIKEHIEIHARKEPHAVEISKILRKAVAELEYLAELEKAYFELREQCTNLGGIKLAQETALSTEYAIEELKKEAEEKAKKRTKGFKYQENCEMSYIMGALDFAEPREKQIKELEKENNILNTKISELKKENTELIKNYQVSRLYLEGYNDAKKEAEKEISELKEQNIKDCESFNKIMKEIKEQWNKEHYQLIKAKDLIAKLYHADECFTYDEEVEQFLKESE